ncbi:MAG TPA: hypothetical protein VN847_13605 [Streptosporangiaceae bacterium]|nr:hypothetical protein [Streptosporangiaceae bacterium]
MHPDHGRAHYALRQPTTHADLRRQEHAAQLRASRLDRPHRSRRWKLNWTMLSPRDVTGHPGQGRSTWTIIISASRPH